MSKEFTYIVLRLLVIMVFLFGKASLVLAQDFGHDKKIKSTPCLFEGTYERGEDYDIESYIENVKVELKSPYTLWVHLTPKKISSGTYISLNFYDELDKKHKPIPNLNFAPTDEKALMASSFVQMRAFPKSDGSIALAPIIYKKGIIYDAQNHKKEFNPFESINPITDIAGNPLGGAGNLFASLFIKVAGEGAYAAKDFENMAFPDKDGIYSFLIHLNSHLQPNIFFIASITKVSILPSGRGLRSSIRTTPLNIKKNC